MEILKQVKNNIVIWSSHFLIKVLRTFKFGGGTALPGLIIEKYYPDFTEVMTSKIKTVILITGTNGKTTTAKIIETVLRESNFTVIRNRSGANLLRGINSTLLENSKEINKGRIEYAIFEVEEASLPNVITKTNAGYLILTNIFRDQLDAYGEIDRTANLIKSGLEKVEDICLIYNIDDARLNSICINHANKKSYGIVDNFNFKDSKDNSDSIHCPICRTKLVYESLVFSHLGKYNCPSCGFNNRYVDYKISEISSLENKLNFRLNSEQYNIGLSGIYNTYNTAAAVCLFYEFGISPEQIQSSLNEVKPAFGRGEELIIDKTKVKIILVKNPTGLNNAFDILNSINERTFVMLALNDNVADGKDISWIWDAAFERINNRTNLKFILTGKRSADLALRFKYADFNMNEIYINSSFIKATEYLLAQSRELNIPKAFILPTYTSMIEIRKYLSTIDKSIDKFWK